LLNGKNGEAYNVGNPEAECSIKELAQALVEMFKDRKINLVQAENMNTNYMSSKVSRIIPNIEKIKELGWYPKINIEEGFYKTILSYKNDVNNESI
jgi:nucleoside-diphosphate-sugar epimerase